MPVNKTKNSYQSQLDPAFYERCPKAVFAAIAVSFVVNLKGQTFHKLESELYLEWLTLYRQGIVPQKPPANLISKKRAGSDREPSK